MNAKSPLRDLVPIGDTPIHMDTIAEDGLKINGYICNVDKSKNQVIEGVYKCCFLLVLHTSCYSVILKVNTTIVNR